MYNLIERYINNLTKDDLDRLARSKEIFFSNEELGFAYDFVKKHWSDVVRNYSLFDIDKYKGKFNEENFYKIKLLFKEYSLKYGNMLK